MYTTTAHSAAHNATVTLAGAAVGAILLVVTLNLFIGCYALGTVAATSFGPTWPALAALAALAVAEYAVRRDRGPLARW